MIFILYAKNSRFPCMIAWQYGHMAGRYRDGSMAVAIEIDSRLIATFVFWKFNYFLNKIYSRGCEF
jgi:hypothetical protein